MRRKGMIESLSTVRGDRHKNYRITASGKEIARILEAVKRDYDKITDQKGTDDAYRILERIKYRGKLNEN